MIKTDLSIHVEFWQTRKQTRKKNDIIIFKTLDLKNKWLWLLRNGKQIDLQDFFQFITFKKFPYCATEKHLKISM